MRCNSLIVFCSLFALAGLLLASPATCWADRPEFPDPYPNYLVPFGDGEYSDWSIVSGWGHWPKVDEIDHNWSNPHVDMVYTTSTSLVQDTYCTGLWYNWQGYDYVDCCVWAKCTGRRDCAPLTVFCQLNDDDWPPPWARTWGFDVPAFNPAIWVLMISGPSYSGNWTEYDVTGPHARLVIEGRRLPQIQNRLLVDEVHLGFWNE